MDFQPLIQRIEAYDSIVIFGHIHPDGDCYGSQIGLKEALKMHYPDKIPEALQYHTEWYTPHHFAATFVLFHKHKANAS